MHKYISLSLLGGGIAGIILSYIYMDSLVLDRDTFAFWIAFLRISSLASITFLTLSLLLLGRRIISKRLYLLGLFLLPSLIPDLFHIFSFVFFPDFITKNTRNKVAYLFILSRALFILAILLSMFHERLIKHKNYVPYVFALLMALSLTGSFGIVFYHHLLPPLHIEGIGPAPYRAVFEYINAVVMFLVGAYVGKKGFFNKNAKIYFSTALYLFALYSVCISLYRHFFDFLIVLGTFYRFLAHILMTLAVLYFEVRGTALKVIESSNRLMGFLGRRKPQKEGGVWHIKMELDEPVVAFYLFDLEKESLVARVDMGGEVPTFNLTEKYRLVKSLGGQYFEERWYYMVHDYYMAVLKLAYIPENPIERLHITNVCRLLLGHFLNVLYFDKFIEERSREISRLYLLLETSQYATQAYNNIDTFSKQVLERLDYVLGMDGSIFYIWNKNTESPERLVFSSGFLSNFYEISVAELVGSVIQEKDSYGTRGSHVYSKFDFGTYESGIIGLRKGRGFTGEELMFLHTVSNQLFHVVKLMKTIEDLEKAQASIRFLSEYDPLTMLYNRKTIEKLLEDEIERANRFDEHFCTLFIDIDNFKLINDTYGRHVGDMALKHIAETLKKNIRHLDRAGRLGGDEFILILPKVNRVAALQIAKRLKEGIESKAIPTGNRELWLSVSMGIVCYPFDAKNLQEIIALGEVLIRMAKKEGKGRINVVDEPALEFYTGYRKTEERLLEAIQKGGIEVFLQDIVDVKTGSLFGFEALMRLRVNSDFLPPAKFIDLAEDTGFMPKLDLAMIERTLEYVKSVNMDFFVCLNLSPAGMTEDFTWRIVYLVKDKDVNPERIVFEITERRALEDMSKAIEFINTLKGFGFKFAIDDFGSGYSSMYYLKYLPVDFVKIEGEFIKSVKTSHVDRTFVKNVVELANILNIKTIAEFVEDKETLDILKELGVDYAQGYYIGKPEPAEEKLRKAFSTDKNQEPEEEG